MKTGSGTFAEFTCVDAITLTKKPKNLSHAEAASFPLAGLTAWQLLVISGGLKQGDGKRIFIVSLSVSLSRRMRPLTT